MANSSEAQSNGHSHGPTTKTYAVDIRYFLLTLLSSMSLFFTLGVVTAPSGPVSTSSSNYVTPISDAPTGTRTGNTNDAPPSNLNHQLNAELNTRHVNFKQPSYEDLGQGNGAIRYNSSTSEPLASAGVDINGNVNVNVDQATGTDANSAINRNHLPAGQHLLVDIKNVEADFLNSEERLSTAMVESVKAAGLTMLSYHCHSLIPSGVSCVGVLLESHISFHTWPAEGVITLDLFTCGENPLLPVVKDLERLFGIPRISKKTQELEEIETSWSHELRGFRNGEPYGVATKANYLDSKSDLASVVITALDLKVKKQVISTSSEYHRIDIWDILNPDETPSYEDAMKANLTENDSRWLTSDVTSPERLFFINGALQSMKDSEKEYHETLVHPAMLANPNPVNIAIIGGGEGASIREVIKHESVQSITMIELDKLIVDIAREHLPYMNDCSNIVDATSDNCFDDERVTIYYEDAKDWFIQRFGDAVEAATEKFDVIILDALNPRDNQNLYSNEEFLNALMNSLSDDGIFATHVGAAHTIHDPRADMSIHAPREKFFQLLEQNEQTGAMILYEEAHCGETVPCAFLAVCKNVECRDRWYAEPMVVDYEISVRIKERKDKLPNLVHFDGSTQHSFQIPPRAWEEVYCRREPTPFECSYRGLDVTKELYEMDIENEANSSFEIKISEEDGQQVTAIYATDDIPEGSYIMPSDLAASFTIAEYTFNSLKSNVEIDDTGDVSVIKEFLEYIEDHGHKTMAEGRNIKYVEVGASFMMRKSSSMEEVNVGRWIPAHPSGKIPVYSPVYDRHMVSFDVFLVATKDIKKGEEIVKPENLWSL